MSSLSARVLKVLGFVDTPPSTSAESVDLRRDSSTPPRGDWLELVHFSLLLRDCVLDWSVVEERDLKLGKKPGK